MPEGCNVLNLDLQPLSLNPLGLTVTLQEFKLVIVAVRGPGTCWATWCAPSTVCSTPEGSSAAC